MINLNIPHAVNNNHPLTYFWITGKCDMLWYFSVVRKPNQSKARKERKLYELQQIQQEEGSIYSDSQIFKNVHRSHNGQRQQLYSGELVIARNHG